MTPGAYVRGSRQKDSDLICDIPVDANNVLIVSGRGPFSNGGAPVF
jgi:hypothetical protein